MVKINFDHFQIAEININHDKLIKNDGNQIYLGTFLGKYRF